VEIATLAKFALAQGRRKRNGNLDEAAKPFWGNRQTGFGIVRPETANLRLAVFMQQGKKRKRQLLFSMVTQPARRRTRMEAGPESSASREAAQKLLEIDPARPMRC